MEWELEYIEGIKSVAGIKPWSGNKYTAREQI